MTSSNIEITSCRETTRGTTPGTPRMRRRRWTGESLNHKPLFETSDQVRDDRMAADPTKVGEQNSGGLNNEFSFPVDGSPESDDLCSALMAEWANTAFRDNDGTADSVITGVTASTSVVAVLTGAVFPLGGLVRFTGFGLSGNNGVRRVTTASATVPAFAGSGLVDEPAPAAAARLKLVGFEGVADDIKAVADGLTSEAGGLDFTTFPTLRPGVFLKVGGGAAGTRFDTAGCNGFVRLVSVAAHKLTCDNLPPAWSADAGAGKTIRVFVPDELRNGKTLIAQTLQRRFSGQDVPTCAKHRGMVVDEFSLDLQRDPEKGKKITYSVTYMGLGADTDTVNLDATPDPETTTGIMSTGVHVGRLNELGARVVAPNFVSAIKLTVKNNIGLIGSIDEMAAVDQRWGDCDVKAEVTARFGDVSTLSAFHAGSPTSYNWPVIRDGQAVLFQLPRLTRTEGDGPNAQGKNQDVNTRFTATASKDTLTASHIIIDRFEYLET
ncbi:phage tail tube protein [Azospirillum doebereinerae]|uniref:phage tail tube protein n=1 Tax=Azospirillum doebereinerae TaxID=92933 RepID=UPI001EE5E398|nr:phage tail tube protein [Azospirillum doebereinerae]MCG5239526.1 phage tail tube protein [Azospirillum doebereinerae]